MILLDDQAEETAQILIDQHGGDVRAAMIEALENFNPAAEDANTWRTVLHILTEFRLEEKNFVTK